MPGLRDLCLKPEVLYESAKFKELRTLLPDLVRTQGRRVLLFSQWTRLLDLMVELCNDLDLGTCRLDGNTPIAERQGMVAAFNDGTSSAKIFLLSTRAGGLGINLTGADAVVVFKERLKTSDIGVRAAATRCEVLLRRRSLLAFSREAYIECTHEIGAAPDTIGLYCVNLDAADARVGEVVGRAGERVSFTLRCARGAE